MNDMGMDEFRSVSAAEPKGRRRDIEPSIEANPSPTLTKLEIVELLFERVGLNKREARDMVEAFFEEVCDALVRGESVKLAGFGNLELRNKPARPGRNPKSGEVVDIAARRVVTFHASQKLKGACTPTHTVE